jgi:hypothetical protein
MTFAATAGGGPRELILRFKHVVILSGEDEAPGGFVPAPAINSLPKLEPTREVDDWDKLPSFDAGEAPRRSTSSLEPNLSSSPLFGSTKRPWYFWVAVFIACELGWFALLHPLVPSSIAGFAVEALLLLPIAGCAVLAIKCITWLQPQRSFLRQGLAIAVACSLGVAIFASAYFARDFLGGQYHYFIWHH